MANLLMQPGPQGDVNHKSFAELYGDPSQDPCQGNYLGMINRFDVDRNPGLTSVRLFEEATAAGPIPQAYLCCTQVRHQIRIKCLYMPSKFTGLFTG
jgi:hypothetical protein